MRRKAKELIAGIMKRYADTVEGLCMELGEFVAETTAEVTECVRYYGGYSRAGGCAGLAAAGGNYASVVPAV